MMYFFGWYLSFLMSSLFFDIALCFSSACVDVYYIDLLFYLMQISGFHHTLSVWERGVLLLYKCDVDTIHNTQSTTITTRVLLRLFEYRNLRYTSSLHSLHQRLHHRVLDCLIDRCCHARYVLCDECQDDMMVALCVHHNIISKKACHNKLYFCRHSRYIRDIRDRGEERLMLMQHHVIAHHPSITSLRR